MSFFYFESIFAEEPGEYIVKGDEFRHIKHSRKIRAGETIHLQDTSGARFNCEVIEVKKSFVRVKTLNLLYPPLEPEVKVHLFISFIKEKAFDFILVKSVELGAASVNFLNSEFSQRIPKGNVLEDKKSRWTEILRQACKQCDRHKPPLLNFYSDLPQAIEAAKEKADCLMKVDMEMSPNSHFYDSQTEKYKNIAAFIGPEGGFSSNDRLYLPKLNFSLGPYTLRSETASLHILSILRNHYDYR